VIRERTDGVVVPGAKNRRERAVEVAEFGDDGGLIARRAGMGRSRAWGRIFFLHEIRKRPHGADVGRVSGVGIGDARVVAQGPRP
jgi:hypothetical protein